MGGLNNLSIILNKINRRKSVLKRQISLETACFPRFLAGLRMSSKSATLLSRADERLYVMTVIRFKLNRLQRFLKNLREHCKRGSCGRVSAGFRSVCRTKPKNVNTPRKGQSPAGFSLQITTCTREPAGLTCSCLSNSSISRVTNPGQTESNHLLSSHWRRSSLLCEARRHEHYARRQPRSASLPGVFI